MKTHWTAITLTAVVGTFISAAAWCQQVFHENQPTIHSSAVLAPAVEDPPTGFTPVGATLPTLNPFEPSIHSKIDEILGRLREADELHKPDLVKELETAVAAEFDADMKHREAELTKLEERVAKLRAQFERRKKAKGEITQLQIKVLVNEIDGLGFSHPQPINADEVRPWRSDQSAAIGIPGDATNADPFSPPPQRAVAPPPSTFPR